MGIRKIINSLPLRRKLLRNFLLRLRSNNHGCTCPLRSCVSCAFGVVKCNLWKTRTMANMSLGAFAIFNEITSGSFQTRSPPHLFKRTTSSSMLRSRCKNTCLKKGRKYMSLLNWQYASRCSLSRFYMFWIGLWTRNLLPTKGVRIF
jgi:hypothetical protein